MGYEEAKARDEAAKVKKKADASKKTTEKKKVKRK